MSKLVTWFSGVHTNECCFPRIPITISIALLGDSFNVTSRTFMYLAA